MLKPGPWSEGLGFAGGWGRTGEAPGRGRVTLAQKQEQPS